VPSTAQPRQEACASHRRDRDPVGGHAQSLLAGRRDDGTVGLAKSQRCDLIGRPFASRCLRRDRVDERDWPAKRRVDGDLRRLALVDQLHEIGVGQTRRENFDRRMTV
jgi:hypothetical protein